MPTYSQRLVGATRVANQFRAAAAALDDMYPILRTWGQLTRRTLKGTKYPPRLAHFKHTRTGRLGSSWSVHKASDRAIEIVNSATYASYVVGNARGEGQRNHPSFKRWWIAREIVDAEIPALRSEILDQIMKRFG